MANTAFNAKFRIVDNNSDRENAPEKNLIIDISVEEAMKMANWLSAMVDNAHVEDTKIRIYKSKSEYDEVAGFSIWGGLWGNSGKIAPLYPKGESEQTVNVRANLPVLPDDVPF